jgi:hypothetical protein
MVYGGEICGRGWIQAERITHDRIRELKQRRCSTGGLVTETETDVKRDIVGEYGRPRLAGLDKSAHRLWGSARLRTKVERKRVRGSVISTQEENEAYDYSANMTQ